MAYLYCHTDFFSYSYQLPPLQLAASTVKLSVWCKLV